MMSGGMGGSSGVTMDDLNRYLQNPYENLESIRSTSVYLTNKHGILRDTNRMIKTLPTLKYSLKWGVEEGSKIDEHEEVVNEFLQDVDVVKFIRDGLYEVSLLGTVIPVLRSKKYIQFLDIGEVAIRFQRNGKWVVEYDLDALDQIRDTQDKIMKIESLPDEVTMGKYTSYKNKKDEKLRFVELNNCEVVALDAFRNSPFGLPYTMGAWIYILQKEMINKVEDSISQRLLTQILMLKAGHFDKDGNKPVTDDVVSPYYRGISEVLKTKDSTARNSSGANGSGLIQLPFFLDLEALKIDTDMFEKDLYNKLDDDLFSSLGVSRALIFGEGGNYSSAMVNSEKLFSVVFSLVEQFEAVINSFISSLLPDDVSCEIKFDKSTVLDKETEISNKHELYMQTGVISPYLEAVLDMPIKDIVELKNYENDLGYDELFKPAQNAYTTSNGNNSNKEAGRPSNDNSGNDDTNKSKTNDGNSTPSPSD